MLLLRINPTAASVTVVFSTETTTLNTPLRGSTVSAISDDTTPRMEASFSLHLPSSSISTEPATVSVKRTKGPKVPPGNIGG